MSQEYLSKEEFKKWQKGQATAAWYNPVDAKIYVGEKLVTKNGRSVPQPTYEDAVFDVNKYKQAQRLAKEGKLDASEAQYKPWIGEWENMFLERAESAGVMTNALFSAIDTTTVLNRLVGTELRPFSIPDAVETIATNGLEYEIDVYSRFNISINVPEGVAAWTHNGSVTTVSFDLTKDVGHIAATDEALMKSRQDIWGAHLNNVTTDFRRAKSAKMADVLETFSATNVGDWDAYTSGWSDANPLLHIQARQDAIEANNGTADTIVSANTGWTAFSTNTHVTPPLASQAPGISSKARVITNIPQLIGVSWYVDNELLSDSVIVMDRQASVLVQGPTRVGQYRLEQEGIDGYVAREWYQHQVVQSGKGAELTSVTT